MWVYFFMTWFCRSDAMRYYLEIWLWWHDDWTDLCLHGCCMYGSLALRDIGYHGARFGFTWFACDLTMELIWHGSLLGINFWDVGYSFGFMFEWCNLEFVVIWKCNGAIMVTLKWMWLCILIWVRNVNF